MQKEVIYHLWLYLYSLVLQLKKTKMYIELGELGGLDELSFLLELSKAL